MECRNKLQPIHVSWKNTSLALAEGHAFVNGQIDMKGRMELCVRCGEENRPARFIGQYVIQTHK